MEIKNNELLRQFEYKDETSKIVVEYVNQEKKIFLTKVNITENTDDAIINEFFTKVMSCIIEKKYKVVPSHPRVISFMKKHPIYKELLPVGIRI
ncbi:MAG: N-acetyltransferase [Flavobacterium sp.]|jgi:hypothetical protein